MHKKSVIFQTDVYKNSNRFFNGAKTIDIFEKDYSETLATF